MKIFQELGEQIEKTWREINYNEDDFPRVAVTAFANANLVSKVNAWEILEWVFTQYNFPEQRDVEANFSNAPITLYNSQHFFIDAYYWLDGTTAIHQHAFTGAFQVLHGSSLHSTFDFNPQTSVNDHFLIGDIKTKEIELLETGDIRPIKAGEEYIHSLFHLDRPSVTIAVRTANNPTKMPQYSYLRPHVAHNPFFKEQAQLKKLQGLYILFGMNHKDSSSLAEKLLSNADLPTTFFILDYFFRSDFQNNLEKSLGITTRQERFLSLFETARKRHGEVIEKFLAVYEETKRLLEIVGRRGLITEPEHRFFLALLLNVNHCERILDLIKKRFPDEDPIEKFLDWTTEISTVRVYGAKESNVLGIENFNDDYIAVLEFLLKGTSDDNIERAIAKSYSEDYAKQLSGSIPEISQKIRSSAIFKGLFA